MSNRNNIYRKMPVPHTITQQADAYTNDLFKTITSDKTNAQKKSNNIWCWKRKIIYHMETGNKSNDYNQQQTINNTSSCQM